MKASEALAEIIACLIKYQARYHGAKHAQALHARANAALKAFSEAPLQQQWTMEYVADMFHAGGFQSIADHHNNETNKQV